MCAAEVDWVCPAPPRPMCMAHYLIPARPHLQCRGDTVTLKQLYWHVTMLEKHNLVEDVIAGAEWHRA